MERKALCKEIEILRKINHPNLIKLYAVYETVDKIYLLQELLMGGEFLK